MQIGYEMNRGNGIILCLILCAAGVLVALFFYHKERKHAEALLHETNMQRMEVIELRKTILENNAEIERLNAVRIGVQTKIRRYETILDSIRGSHTPMYDSLRTADTKRIERYFMDRYRHAGGSADGDSANGGP